MRICVFTMFLRERILIKLGSVNRVSLKSSNRIMPLDIALEFFGCILFQHFFSKWNRQKQFTSKIILFTTLNL